MKTIRIKGISLELKPDEKPGDVLGELVRRIMVALEKVEGENETKP